MKHSNPAPLPVDRPFPGAHLLLLLLGLGEPARCHELGFGEEADAVLAEDVAFPEEGVFVAGEGEEAHRHRDTDVYAHHAGVGAAGEFPGVITALGEDAGAVGEAALVHEGDALFEVLHALNRADRAEEEVVPLLMAS